MQDFHFNMANPDDSNTPALMHIPTHSSYMCKTFLVEYIPLCSKRKWYSSTFVDASAPLILTTMCAIFRFISATKPSWWFGWVGFVHPTQTTEDKRCGKALLISKNESRRIVWWLRLSFAEISKLDNLLDIWWCSGHWSVTQKITSGIKKVGCDAVCLMGTERVMY